MAKINSAFHGCNGFGDKSKRNNLFNLNSFNELKKDQTKIKIFKNSSFDSSFNSIQSLNTYLSQLVHLPSPSLNGANLKFKAAKLSPLTLRKGINNKNIKISKISAILRAIRSIRLNRDEWKLIRYINLMEKKIRSNQKLGCCASTPSQSLGFFRDLKFSGVAALQQLNDPLEIKQVENSNGSIRGEANAPKIKGVALQKNKRKLNLEKIKKLIAQAHLNPFPAKATNGGRLPKPSTSKSATPSKSGVALAHKYLIIKQNNKIFTNNNIISKNILLRNMKYYFLKSTLSSILKKKLRKISEVLEDKPVKNYVIYSYLKNCISSLRLGTPPHLNGARTKLSLNKYKGKKFGSLFTYNKIIGYKFNSTFYPSCFANSKFGLEKSRNAKADIFIKDTYKLLFYLFKSMYCLISKPVLKYSNDKITIQLFYYLNIPKKKVFRLFSISYINSIKKKWLFNIEKKKIGESNQNLRINKVGGLKLEANSLIHPSFASSCGASLALKAGKSLASLERGRLGNTKIYIRWKLRKAISRFKNKILFSSCNLGLRTPKQEQKNLFFKLRKFNLTFKAVFQNKFKLICAILSNKFNKPVELQLIRLHHPYHDSNILVNLLSLNIKNKRKKARVAIQKIYNKKPVKNLNDPNLNYPSALNRLDKQGVASTALNGEGGKFIPAFLSGLNIKIAGRLMGEPIIPRITTKIFGKGASAIGKVNYSDVARITKKNRKGAYTIKITSGQNFF
jgi:Mitochondrial ribosomal protein (VAR1)